MGKISIYANEANHETLQRILKEASEIANTTNLTVTIYSSMGVLEVKAHEKKEEKQSQHPKNVS